MTKKTEETPIMHRSSYIDVNTGQQTTQPVPTTETPEVGSPELRQTIAEARAAMTADLKAKLPEYHLWDPLAAKHQLLTGKDAGKRALLKRQAGTAESFVERLCLGLCALEHGKISKGVVSACR